MKLCVLAAQRPHGPAKLKILKEQHCIFKLPDIHLVAPLGGGDVLYEEQNTLEILLLLQLNLPSEEKGRAHVQVELAKPVLQTKSVPSVQ